MRRHRTRRKNRLRCVMVELREREIDALIRRAGLPPEDRADHAAIRTALYGFFDATCGDAKRIDSRSWVARHFQSWNAADRSCNT